MQTGLQRALCAASLLTGLLSALAAAAPQAPPPALNATEHFAVLKQIMGGTDGRKKLGSLLVVEGLTTGMVTGRERLIVGSGYDWGVSIFGLDGRPVANWGVPDPKIPGRNVNLADVATDPDGRIYASDYRGHRVVVFTAHGDFLKSIGSPGEGPANLLYPIGLKVIDGALYVVEHGNDRIHVFDLNGNSIRVFGGHGSGPGQFDGAYDIAFDSRKEIFITDRGNKRVEKFDKEGRFIAEWGGAGITNDPRSSAFSYIHEIAIDAKDRVYVSDYSRNAVRVFDAEGHYLASILVHGPKGLTISSDQSIFVGIADHNLVLKLGRLDDLLKSEN